MLKEIESHFEDIVAESKTLKSGWAGEITLLTMKKDPRKLIVKTYSSDEQGKANLEREWQGLSVLSRNGFPVPKPIWINVNSERPFLVMEAVLGQNLWDVYEKADEDKRIKLADDFTKLFHQLHRFDPRIMEDVFHNSDTTSFLTDELSEINDLMKRYKLNELACFYSWLVSNAGAVVNIGLSIIHRDYHPWNVLVDLTENSYVIDWLWGIGDYRFDLLWTVALMERSGFEEFSRDVLKLYEQYNGSEVPDKDYFMALASLRWLINVLISYKTGQNLNEERRREFRQFIEPLMRKAIETLNRITGSELSADSILNT